MADLRIKYNFIPEEKTSTNSLKDKHNFTSDKKANNNNQIKNLKSKYNFISQDKYTNQQLQQLGKDITEKGKKAGSILGNTFMKALGVISWPFLRAEYGVATPIHGMQKALEKRRKKKGLTASYLDKPKAEELVKFKEIPGLVKEAMPSIKTGLKSFVPFTEADPEEVKTFTDVGEQYYEARTGQKAPGWYKNMFGMSASFLVTPAIVSKYIKGLSAPFKAARKTQLARNLASKAKYKALKGITRTKTIGRKGKAYEIGKELTGKRVKSVAKELSDTYGRKITPKAVKLRLNQLIKGGITKQQSLREIANPVKLEFSQLSKEAVKYNLLPEYTYISKLPKKVINNLRTKKSSLQKQLKKLKTQKVISPKTGKAIQKRYPGKAVRIREIQKQIDTLDKRIKTSYKLGGTNYMPRIYQTIEEANLTHKPSKYSPRRIRASYAKARKPIPAEVRKKMGEIKEPAYPVTKRIVQEGADLENARFFRQIARRKEWASNTYKKGMFKEPLPNTKAYGDLAGKYVKPHVYNDVKSMVGIKNNFEKIYDTMIGSWKLGKVVLNPSTHFRNMFSNSILLDLSGMDHMQQIKYLGRATKLIKSGSDEYKFASRHLGRTGMVGSELMDDMLKLTQSKSPNKFSQAINGITNYSKRVAKKGLKRPADIYQEEEFIGKFLKYLQSRDKGFSRMRSVREANKWLFDYGDLANWERKIARRIMPFYTFPRKALPRVLEAVQNNPYAIAKYPLMAWTLTKHSLSKLKLTDKDYDQIHKVLPEYMKGGNYLLMPFKDNNNDLRFLDWTYLVPWGELYEAENRGLLKQVITNPLFQITSDIMHNKSSWSGQEIWQETDTTKEKQAKKLMYVWRQAAPNLAPGGIYWDKLYDSITGKKYGLRKRKEPSFPLTALHTLTGLRTQGINPREQAMYRNFETMNQLKELQNKKRDLMLERNTKNISTKEYKKRYNQYQKQMNKLYKERRQRGTPPILEDNSDTKSLKKKYNFVPITGKDTFKPLTIDSKKESEKPIHKAKDRLNESYLKTLIGD